MSSDENDPQLLILPYDVLVDHVIPNLTSNDLLKFRSLSIQHSNIVDMQSQQLAAAWYNQMNVKIGMSSENFQAFSENTPSHGITSLILHQKKMPTAFQASEFVFKWQRLSYKVNRMEEFAPYPSSLQWKSLTDDWSHRITALTLDVLSLPSPLPIVELLMTPNMKPFSCNVLLSTEERLEDTEITIPLPPMFQRLQSVQVKNYYEVDNDDAIEMLNQLSRNEVLVNISLPVYEYRKKEAFFDLMDNKNSERTVFTIDAGCLRCQDTEELLVKVKTSNPQINLFNVSSRILYDALQVSSPLEKNKLLSSVVGITDFHYWLATNGPENMLHEFPFLRLEVITGFGINVNMDNFDDFPAIPPPVKTVIFDTDKCPPLHLLPSSLTSLTFELMRFTEPSPYLEFLRLLFTLGETCPNLKNLTVSWYCESSRGVSRLSNNIPSFQNLKSLNIQLRVAVSNARVVEEVLLYGIRLPRMKLEELRIHTCLSGEWERVPLINKTIINALITGDILKTLRVFEIHPDCVEPRAISIMNMMQLSCETKLKDHIQRFGKATEAYFKNPFM